jgi:PmbA protein
MIMQKSLQNSNRMLPALGKEISVLMENMLTHAREKGASDAVVAVSQESGFSIDVRMKEVETIAFHEAKGLSVTVYFGQSQGSASSTDISIDSLRSTVEAACEIAKVSAPDPCFGLADRSLVTHDFPDLDLYHPWSITPPEAIERALACEQLALGFDKRITNSDGVSVSTYNFCNGYADSFGRQAVVSSSRHSISCSLIAQDGAAMQRDYDYTTARLAEELVAEHQIAQRAAERAVNRLGARKIKTQTAPVIFSSRVSSGIFGAFVGAISGSNLYRKNSFLLDSIGQQVFPKGIQIYEQPHLVRGLGSFPYDGEGVLTRNNVLVKDGEVRQYVLGSYSARRLGLETTANSGGVFNLTVDATAGDLQALLRQMGTGLLVTELMGHGVNGLTGDYSRGATGFWVEDGVIQYPVEEITIAGNLKEMFQHIVAVGSDINPNISTRCGSVLIEQMMIGGA